MPREAKKAEDMPVPAPEQAPPVEVEAAPYSGSEQWDVDEAPVATVVARVVTFQLDGQFYGLPIEAVQEIQQIVEFTPLPHAVAALVGLIDLRGAVVPAIDLRVLLGIPAREFTAETPMIFCRVRGHVVCFIVDEVEDVVDLPEGALQPPSGLYSLADQMIGSFRLDQGLVLLLDIERLVPDAALAAADGLEGESQ